MNYKILTLLLAVIALTGQAKTIVWEQPTTESGNSYGDGYFNLALDVTKVELKDNETVVYITAQQRSDYPDFSFQFAGDTYLKVGETRYTIVSADGIELNKFVQTNKNGKREMAFHFPALPRGTTSFDFIEGDGQGAFQIKGIKPVEERWKQLFPSYWRDDKMGDWKIAFFEDCAIYDCKFWNYKECNVNSKSGGAEIVMTNGNDELKVSVSKDKKGIRTIQVGNQKAKYSMITSRFLPDYPTKDTRTDFVNNGYKTDTITVVGWIKDMPERFKKENTFSFGFDNLFTDDQEEVIADLDEQGRFCVKIPVLNSTEFFCDWSRCFLRTMFEPGKTYFLLYDFKEGRRYFMGDDCRLQNELYKYPLDWKSIRMLQGDTDFNRYITSVDSLIKTQYAYIDDLCKEHPTLSTRFNIFRKGNTLIQQACDFGQSRFRGPKYEFPTCGNNFSWNVMDHVTEYASNDEELALLNKWKNWAEEANARIDAAGTQEEKQRIAEQVNAEQADMIKAVEKILNGKKGTKIVSGQALIARMKSHMQMLDSLNADPLIKDIWLSQMVCNEIDHRRTSLLPEVLDTLRALCSSSYGVEIAEKQNERYLAIENREFDKLVIKSSDNLKDLSEGEALLKKIMEPFKGKFVLLDVWGTWCGPCKEALKHSTEEYARLKDYDIQYLYLANRSPMDSWENIIKEYNVSGDNVAHYNLPEEQQSAIERYLNVRAFPTYKLFDRNGNLLDLEVDARDFDRLASLLEQMK